MDTENLKKAVELKIEIDDTKQQIKWLSEATEIRGDVTITIGYVKRKNIDFKLLKTITLSQMREKLENLETEFKNI